MPKVSQFTAQPFPTASTQFPLIGEKKLSFALASRVLWEGAQVEGSGSPPQLVFTSESITGSTVIPADFFDTYNAIEFNAFVDITGMVHSTYNHLYWQLSPTGVASDFNAEIPFSFPDYTADADAQTLEIKVRLIRTGTTFTSSMTAIMAKDDYDAKVIQMRYANLAFDGSVSGVLSTIPLYAKFSLNYAVDPHIDFPQQPLCLYSRLTY